MKNPLKVMSTKQRAAAALTLVVGIVFLGITWFSLQGNSPDVQAKSQVTIRPHQQNIGGKASKEYQKLEHAYDTHRVKSAETKGQTAVSSIGALKGIDQTNAAPKSQYVSMEPARPVVPEHSSDDNHKAIDAKRQFLVSLMKSWGHAETVKWTTVAKTTGNANTSERRSGVTPGKHGSAAGQGHDAKQDQVHAITAGDLLVGISDLDINSDDGGPVSLTVVTGPMRGANVLGKFKLTASDRLLIEFQQMSWHGYSVAIHAYAVDSSYRTSVASHVDQHYLYRLGMTLGSAFLKGLQAYGQAVQNAGATTVNSGTGTTTTVNDRLSAGRLWQVAGGQMAGSVAGELDKRKAIKPTVTAPRGTLMGILFVKSVDAAWLPQLSPDHN